MANTQRVMAGKSCPRATANKPGLTSVVQSLNLLVCRHFRDCREARTSVPKPGFCAWMRPISRRVNKLVHTGTLASSGYPGFATLPLIVGGRAAEELANAAPPLDAALMTQPNTPIAGSPAHGHWQVSDIALRFLSKPFPSPRTLTTVD
jgi:hypothetical protein